MADNVAITAGSGTNIGTDDVGGVHYQKVKLDAGGDGASVPVVAGQQAMAASVPVVIASNQSAVPVSAASLPLPAGASTAALQGGGLPAALGAGGGLKVDGSGTALPVSGNVGIASVAIPTTLYCGQNTVAAAGTQEALAASQALLSGVTIKALANNTGIVYVGDSNVSSATGFALAAGEQIFVEIANLATVYIDAAVNDDGVSYIGS